MVKHRAIAVGYRAAVSWSTAATGRDTPAAIARTRGRHAAAGRPEVADAPGRAEPDPAVVRNEELVMPGIAIAAATGAGAVSATELDRWETDGGTWIA